MTEIVKATTLDDALLSLSERVALAEARGEKNFIFCEDRLTLLAERAVVATRGATFFSEVSTFARFLSGSGKVLSKQGSIVALSEIMQREKDNLACFSGASAQAIYETIAQMLSSRVGAELLIASAEETEGSLRRKLSDLALLLERYEAFLHENALMDENGYLALLPDRIAAGDFSNTNIYFFAFPSFTAQAREGVRAAIEHAHSVTGIFISRGEGADFFCEAERDFAGIAAEYGEMRETTVKSTAVPEARTFARGLFSPEIFSSSDTGERDGETGKVHVFYPDDETKEFETVCALIGYYAHRGLRYRDMTVLANGSDFSAAERAFERFGIPYFADRKRPFSEHPFSEFLFSVFDGAADGGLPDTVDAIAASVYFGDGDAYRNYLLKYGAYRGAYRREIKDGDAVKGYRREALCACRERMEKILLTVPRTGTGHTYLSAVRSLRELVNEREITEKLALSFEGAEKEFLEADALEGILEEIGFLVGGQTFTAREFGLILQNGLSALSVSMVPQLFDAVLLTDCTDGKFARARVLFATQMTDMIPRVSADTSVVSDRDIDRLKKLKVEIEPQIAVVNARARESLALNLTAFSDALYLSCPARMGGEEQMKSEVLAYAERLFGKNPPPSHFVFTCPNAATAVSVAYEWKDAFESGRTDDVTVYSTLHALLEEVGEREIGAKADTVSAAGDLWFSRAASPTLLEHYFICPYRSFVEKGLRLREREERAVLDTDAGTFVHAVMERMAHKLNDLASEEACREQATDIAKALLKTPKYAQFSDTGEGSYAGARLVGESVSSVLAAYRQLALSSFRVRSAEEPVSIPRLDMKGTADRVDEAEDFVRIVDYKTGMIDDEPESYYVGKKLQLQLYLLAAAGEKKAAGAFYFPARETYTAEGEYGYTMRGFFSSDERAIALMDKSREPGKKSAFFEGGSDRASDKKMTQEEFDDFLSYSLLVSEDAEKEMKDGNIEPSPYGNACGWCTLKGMCAFVGTPRKEGKIGCREIVRIVRRERGDE